MKNVLTAGIFCMLLFGTPTCRLMAQEFESYNLRFDYSSISTVIDYTAPVNPPFFASREASWRYTQEAPSDDSFGGRFGHKIGNGTVSADNLSLFVGTAGLRSGWAGWAGRSITTGELSGQHQASAGFITEFQMTGNATGASGLHVKYQTRDSGLVEFTNASIGTPEFQTNVAAGSPDGMQNDFNYFAVAWSLTPEFIGESPSNPISVTTLSQDFDDNLTNGRQLFGTPVFAGESGQADLVFFESNIGDETSFTSELNSFTSIQIPDLPQGDDKFLLMHDSTQYELEVGQIFDFTAIDPLGAESFGLKRVRASESANRSTSSLVFGATFRDVGLGQFSAQVTSVPEPSTIYFLGLSGLSALLVGRNRRRTKAVNC